jgi:hypothetical protein
MSLTKHWLAQEDQGVQFIASGAQVASGNSGDISISGAAYFGEAGIVPVVLAVGVDITVNAGTQASVDFDMEFKGPSSQYYRVARKNVAPAAGAVAFVLVPTTDGAQGGHLPFCTATWRLRWTFNTPGGGPTITFSAVRFGWGYRNNGIGWPGMR